MTVTEKQLAQTLLDQASWRAQSGVTGSAGEALALVQAYVLLTRAPDDTHRVLTLEPEVKP